MKHSISRSISLVVVAFVLLTACAKIAPFSEAAYQQSISLKVETLVLMDRATDPYTGHQAEVESLMLAIDKAYEDALVRPDNDKSAEQWELLKNPDSNLVGGFMRWWKDKGQLSGTFIADAKTVVSDAFDRISALERGKPRTKNATIGGGN